MQDIAVEIPADYDRLGSLAVAIAYHYEALEAMPQEIVAALTYTEAALHSRDEEHIRRAHEQLVEAIQEQGLAQCEACRCFFKTEESAYYQPEIGMCYCAKCCHW